MVSGADERELSPFGAGDPGRMPEVVWEHAVDALSLHDAAGRYLEVSPSFETLSGFRREELTGRGPIELELVHPDDVDEVVEAQARALEGRGPFRVTYRLRRRDDAYVWVESTGRVVDTLDGERFVVITREAADVQSLMRGLELERTLAKQLESLAARQRTFLTAMNHRARTPVTRVLGYARLLGFEEIGRDDERRDRIQERLVQSALELRDFVNQTTEAESLSTREAVLERRVVDVGELVGRVVDDRVASDAVVTVEVPEATRARVDPAKLRLAVEMLIGNAFAHTPVGTHVRVRLGDVDDGLHLVVEDGGPGVPVDVRDRVFDAFERGDPDEADPGAGLGLYIVAEVAALHGGRAWVDDAADGGAAFHLHLPDPSGTDVASADPTEWSEPEPEFGSRAASFARLTRESRGLVSSMLGSIRTGLDMQAAYLTVFVDGEQLVVAVEGDGEALGLVPGRRIPLEETFCLRMIEDRIPQVVADTSSEPALAELPASDDIGVYVGVPVHGPEGQVIGTLCCAGATPLDEMPATVTETLTALSRLITRRLTPPAGTDQELAAATARITEALVRPASPRIVYQPIVDLRDGRIAGYEALSRFDDDRPVALWFTDAAKVGLLAELELRAAKRAVDGFVQVTGRRLLSINLSPETIVDEDLAPIFDGLDLDRTVLEVTEHAAVDDYDALHAAVAPWRERGLRLAIDDVGGGFSSLRHVVQLRPDIIKIDRSLIRDVATDPVQRAAAASIARLARELDATVIAEGLETGASLDAIRSLGVDHAQGWLLARPDATLPTELPEPIRARLSPGDEERAV